MKKALWIFPFLCLLLVPTFFNQQRSFFDHQQGPSELARIEAKHSLIGRSDPLKTQRNLAAEGPLCASDRYTLVELKKDIRGLLQENNRQEPYRQSPKGLPSNFSELKKSVASLVKENRAWRGIPLKGIPMGHVEFFKASEEVLSPDVDVSHCRSAPCVFNTVYQRDLDDIAGHTAFFFFLKTGYVLSGIKKVKGLNIDVSDLPLSDFYFRDPDLKLLWKWAQLVPFPFFYLYPVEVYRFPYNQALTKDPLLAGRASFIGKVIIKREGTSIQEIQKVIKPLSGYVIFFERAFLNRDLLIIAHEFGHIYDFSEYYSYKENFLNLSGWKEKSYQEEGRLIQKWEDRAQEPEFEGFIRDYAGSTPREDFADSIAHYLVRPNKFKEFNPKKFRYVKNNIFQGRDFTHSGNRHFYEKKLLDRIQENFHQWVLDCSFEKTDSSCFDEKLALTIDQWEKDIKSTDFFACPFFEKFDRGWWQEAVDAQMASLSEKVPPRVANSDGPSQQKSDLSDLVIDCTQNSPKPQECYQKGLYAQERPGQYATDLSNVTLRTKNILQISGEELQKTAQDLINSCSAEKTFPSQPVHEDEVNLLNHENDHWRLQRWFLSCLQAQQKETLTNFIHRKIKEDIQMKLSSNFLSFSVDIYQPDFNKTLNDSAQKLVEKQKKQMKNHQKKIMATLLKHFESHDRWNLTQENDVFGACRKKAATVIKEKKLTESFVVYFPPHLSTLFCDSLTKDRQHFKLFKGLRARETLFTFFHQEWSALTPHCPSSSSLKKKCRSLQVLPAVDRAWDRLSESAPFQNFSSATQKQMMIRDLIASIRANFL